MPQSLMPYGWWAACPQGCKWIDADLRCLSRHYKSDHPDILPIPYRTARFLTDSQAENLVGQLDYARRTRTRKNRHTPHDAPFPVVRGMNAAYHRTRRANEAAKMASNATYRPSLLGIPIELREHIFQYLVGPSFRYPDDLFEGDFQDQSLALSRVSRQLRLDVLRYLAQNFSSVRAVILTKLDYGGLRANSISRALRAAPLFLINPELHLDAKLPKILPTLQLQAYIENADWPEVQPLPNPVDQYARPSQHFTVEEAEAAFERYVAQDIASDDRIDTEESWNFVARPKPPPRREVQLQRHEISFIFQEETFEKFLDALRLAAAGTRAGLWSGIEQLKLNFSPHSPSPPRELDRYRMLRQMLWRLKVSSIQISGLPAPDIEHVSTIITTDRVSAARLLERFASGIEDLVNGKYHSAYTTFHSTLLPQSHDLPNLWYRKPLSQRRFDYLHQEMSCLANLALTKVRNRQLQAFIAAGGSGQLSIESLRDALQMARQAYDGVGLSNLHRADAFWECGLMHRWTAEYVSLHHSFSQVSAFSTMAASPNLYLRLFTFQLSILRWPPHTSISDYSRCDCQCHDGLPKPICQIFHVSAVMTTKASPNLYPKPEHDFRCSDPSLPICTDDPTEQHSRTTNSVTLPRLSVAMEVRDSKDGSCSDA